MVQAAAEAVQSPHHERVVGPQVVQAGVELRTAADRARADVDGAAETAGRTLRPRLRETVRIMAAELADPARYGAGLLEPAQPRRGNALRSMLWLGPASAAAATAPDDAEQSVQGLQPTLEDARLRAAAAPPVFPSPEPAPPSTEAAAASANSLRPDQDASPAPAAKSLPPDQQAAAKPLPANQDAPIAGDSDPSQIALADARVAMVGVVELGDGRVRLQLGGGVELLLPAGVAQAAGLVENSLRRDQDAPPAAAAKFLPADQQVPSPQPGPPPKSLPSNHERAGRSGSRTGITAGESSSDDSDRARGNRLPAALAPRTTPELPPAAAAQDRNPRAGPPDDVADQRRSA